MTVIRAARPASLLSLSLGLALSAGALAACSSSAPAPGTSPAATASAVTSGTGASGAASSATSSTRAATGSTSATGAGTTPSATTSAAPATSSGAQGAQPSASVDATQFLTTGGVGSGHYFVTPSGNLACAITAGSVGWQSKALVANLPQCNNPDDKQAMVTYDRAKGVTRECTSQGAYYVDPQSPRPPVLAYDTTLSADGFTCVSVVTGVTCTDTATKKGFVASTQGFESR